MYTIYKKDNSWKIRYLRVETNGSNLIQSSWVIWTENEVSSSKLCYWKNIGRANETTSLEQAIKEMNSIILDKQTKWYFSSIDELNMSNEVLLPMLAKDFNKEFKKIDWDNCYVQPKLDWMRALIKISKWVTSVWSRQWKPILTVPHIVSEFNIWAREFSIDNKVLDWELYAHWFSFQQNMEMVKKFREWISNKYIKFHIYDIVDWNSFEDRFLFSTELVWLPNICIIVPTKKIDNISFLKKSHSINIENWFEGSIVRWWEAWYKPNWRSSNLLKYKDFLDMTAQIIDVIPSEARPSQWIMVCVNEDWNIFKASLKFSFEERERILNEKFNYVWQTAEIRFFEYTDWWLPRFPVCVWFRLDK